MRKFSIGLFCAASSMAICNAAPAQAQGAPAEGAQTQAQADSDARDTATARNAGDADEATIVVTGSRVASALNSPTPLTEIVSEQLLKTTPATIPDGLNKLPVFKGSQNTRTINSGGANDSNNVLSLRGFGPGRTLVLLDGHRLTPSNPYGTVNVDTIPQLLVERVDIVTGGASAVYGSDAVTGVVNFILDKDLTGLRYSASYGLNDKGLGKQKQLGIAGGSEFLDGRGHVLFSGRLFDSDLVKNSQLPYGGLWSYGGVGTEAVPYQSYPDTRIPWSTFGGLVQNCGTGCTAAGQQFVSPGVLGPFTAGVAIPGSSLQSGGDGGYYAHNTAIAALRSGELFGRLSYDLGSDTTAYVNVSWAKSRNVLYFTDGITQYGVPNAYFKNNPYLSPDAQAALATGSGTTFNLGRFFPDLPPQRVIGHNKMINVTAGLEGKLWDRFDWEIFYTQGANRLLVETEGNTNNMRLLAAQDAVVNPATGQVVCNVSLTHPGLYPGCVPLNPFGPNTLTRQNFDYVSDTTAWRGSQNMKNVGASIAGDVFQLPAGPVKVAVSGEARWTDLAIKNLLDPSTTFDCTGLRLCPAFPPSVWPGVIFSNLPKVKSRVWEAAVEANIPILRDQPFFRSLAVNLAGRHTDYSTSGPVNTWKVGLDWHVSRDVRFRATRSRDIRAPNLMEFYGPTNAFWWDITDQHVIDPATGFPAYYPVIQPYGGNPNLLPEIAKTLTVGTILTPSFIPGLSFSADYYSIEMANAMWWVNGRDPAIQNRCEDSGGTDVVCSLYVRPLPFSDRSMDNRATAVRVQQLNVALNRISGLDFELNYRFDGAELVKSLSGSFTFRGLVNVELKNEYQSYAGQPVYENVGSKVLATAFMDYRLSSWNLSLQHNWRSGFKKAGSSDQIYVPARVPSFYTLDATLTKTVKIGPSETDLYVSVQNLFDKSGPLWASTNEPGRWYPVPSGYSVLGRYFTFGVRGKF